MATVRPDARRPKDRFIVRFKFKGIGFKHTCEPIDKRSAKKVADDLAGGRRTSPEPDSQWRPTDTTGSQQRRRDALKAFIMGVKHELPVQPTTNGGTLEKLVDAYLASRQERVNTSKKGTRKLSVESYASDVARLNEFKKYCKNRGKATLSAIVNADFLGGYRTYQLKQVSDEKTSPANAKHRLRTVKAMLKWAYRQEKIERIPRNVEAPEFADVDLPAPTPKTFTKKQIERLYKNANTDMKLWILLALNAGYTQSDIANLTHDMLDWKNGIIRRGREKTGVQSEHKLWPITLEMLREQSTDPAEHECVLLNSNGRELSRTAIKSNGDPHKVETIGQAFRRLRTRLDLKLSFKHLRKTGASAIEKEFQQTPWLASLYLSHELSGKIRQHYTHQSFDALHEATAWLCEYFGFNDVGTLSGFGGNNSQ